MRFLPLALELALVISVALPARAMQETFCVSRNYQGFTARATRPSASSDERRIVFESTANNMVEGDTNGQQDIFVRDQLLGTTTRLSVSSTGEEANGPSYDPHISADGRIVVFTSYASNLVPGDTNGTQDVFVKDLSSGSVQRASISSIGAEGNGALGSYLGRISADGNYVSFSSDSSDLVPGDTNGEWDVFVHSLVNGETTRVSVGSGGIPG